MTIEPGCKPTLGESWPMYIDGEVRQMIWNGGKWLVYADVYPLIYFAQTGRPLDMDGKKLP